MRASISIAVGFVCLAVAVPYLHGQLVEVAPFAGDNSEDFNSFPFGTGGHATLDVFGGDVMLVAGEGGSVKTEASSSRGGDLVVPRSPPVFAGQFSTMEWNFHTPISHFGGFFENNSRFDDVEVEFFDAQDQLIGMATANVPHDAQAWTWNGWRSDTPIHRITTAGNDIDFLRGFVWFDDMQISYAVPEPTSGSLATLLLLSLVGALRRRRRSELLDGSPQPLAKK